MRDFISLWYTIGEAACFRFGLFKGGQYVERRISTVGAGKIG